MSARTKELEAVFCTDDSQESLEARKILDENGVVYVSLTEGFGYDRDLLDLEHIDAPEIIVDNTEYKGLPRIISFVNERKQVKK